MKKSENTKLKSLLTTSMREKPDSYVINEILLRYPTVSDLAQVTEEELIEIKGIGASKAKQFLALLDFAKTYNTPPEERYTIKSPINVFQLLESDFKHLMKEHFVTLLLNTKNQVIFKEVVSVGTLNSAIVHPREVFRNAIKRSSATIICAHNHPSGDPFPSAEDISLTKKIKDAGNIIGIEVLDHIIIGNNTFYSLKEKGHM